MGGKASRPVPASTAHLDAQIKDLVKRKHAEFLREDSLHPLNKIMLQSETIAGAFRKIRRSFHDFHRPDTDRVDHADLVKTMAELGANCDDETIETIFHASDKYDEHSLSFNEFLVCLALAYLLDLIPGLSVEENRFGGRLASAPKRRGSSDSKRVSDSGHGEGKGTDAEAPTGAGGGASSGASTGGGSGGGASGGASVGTTSTLVVVPQDSPATAIRRRSSAAAVSAHSVAIRNAFHLVLEAYMYFDTKGEGVIRRDAFSKAMEDEVAGGASKRSRGKRHASGPAMSMLTSERFAELDWDKDGTITFKEFLFAFEDWIGLNDDDEEEGGDAEGK